MKNCNAIIPESESYMSPTLKNVAFDGINSYVLCIKTFLISKFAELSSS